MANQCLDCDMGFATPAELSAHLLNRHTTIGTPLNSAPPLPESFDQTMAMIQEEEKKKKTKQLPTMTKVPPPTKEERKPILLTYKFVGACPDCGVEPTTLMLDVGEEYFATAYCIPEAKQLKSIKVEKLEAAAIGGKNGISK